MQASFTKLDNLLEDFTTIYSVNSFCAVVKKQDKFFNLYRWHCEFSFFASKYSFIEGQYEKLSRFNKEYIVFSDNDKQVSDVLLAQIEIANHSILLLFTFNTVPKKLTLKAMNTFLKIKLELQNLYFLNEFNDEREFSHLFFDLIPEAVFVSDIYGQIMYVNKTACHLAEYSNIELKQLAINEITKSSESSSKMFDIYEVKQAEQLLFGTILHTKTGKELPIRVSTQFLSINNTDLFISYVKKEESLENEKSEIFQKVIETQNNERKRFSKDLHDGLGPLLSLAKLYVSDINSPDLSREEREESVIEVIQLIDEAVETTRRIANNLVPTVLKEYGLENALNEFISQIERNNRLNIKFISKGENALDLNVQMEIYQIVRELLNNTLKHSKATNAILSLNFRKKHLSLNYSDNGIGFDENKLLLESKGMGLSNIVSRVEVLKGKVVMHSEIDKGIRVEIEI